MNQPLPPEPANPVCTQTAQDFYSPQGPLPTAWGELRRFPRFYYRTQVAATIHPLPGMNDAAPRPRTLLTRDVSRGGIDVLHVDQLFPSQRIDLTLPDGQRRSVEVVWCRRLAPRCWSAGCRFIRPEAEGSTTT
jgi:hypothetical protein